jgi:hypothetical protein
MPFPPVVVDIGPPPNPPELSTTLIAACSDAVPSGSCLLSSHAERPRRPRAVVYVTWQHPGQRAADLSVTMGESGAGRQVVRTLTFHDADAPLERWRAVGFAVGALVDEQEAVAATNRPPPAPPTPPVPVQDAQPGSEDSDPGPLHHPFLAGLGALAAPGLSDGGWRFGGWLRADLTFEAAPLLVTGAVSYAASPEDDRGLNANWLTMGLGAGGYLNLPTARLGLRLRAEVIAERLGVWAHDQATGLEDSGSRWAVGPRVGLDGCWPYDGVVAAVAGVTAWTLNDDTVIRMHGQDEASVPWAALGLGIGVQLRVP